MKFSQKNICCVVKDADLGVSCMGEKVGRSFALCDRAPYTLVPEDDED
jgi:hypothetical protein